MLYILNGSLFYIQISLTNGKELWMSLYTLQGSKNISIKMLKDIGMIVLKSRETSAVYMQQDK